MRLVHLILFLLGSTADRLCNVTAFSVESSRPSWPKLPRSDHADIATRRNFLRSIIPSLIITSIFTDIPSPSFARNLPQSTGADLSKTGTVETLIPILKIQKCLQTTKLDLTSVAITSSSFETIENIYRSLKSCIPADEISFKKTFDEYSDPVSYKQKFLDQNAFLVYYTNGFDGPNRPSIESGDIPRQTLQYGARNDAWDAVDNLMVEITFAKSEGKWSLEDILPPLDRAIAALDSYLSLVPSSDIEEGRNLLKTLK